jgi:class 3 adenylate cyclase
MNCPKCRSDNREGIRFCEECGAKFELECPDCKAKIPLGKKFCGKCGHDLSKSAKPAPAEANEHEIQIAKSPPEETTPTPIQADGERKQVTVLFSDLSGYTEISEKLDPEDVKEITSRIFGEISKIVGKYDGFIEKYAGDAMLAIFGVPKAHEDDAIRAIKAGREIHKVVEDISAEQEEMIGFPLSMHTGIATGLVVTGQINFERGTHGVSGEALNIASRLSNLATAGEILVDVKTFRLAEEHIKFEKLKSTSVKGKNKKVQPYKFVSERKVPLTHQLSDIKADLIGRNTELLQLNEGLEQLLSGKGNVFLIYGEAGTGKSRLIEEFKLKLDQTQIQWFEGHAYPYSQNMPYFPIINIFKQALNIQEDNSPHEIEIKIKSFVENMEGGQTIYCQIYWQPLWAKLL